MVVAQYSLWHSGHLHHCRSPGTHPGYQHYVRVCGADGRALHRQYWSGVVCASDAAGSARGEKESMKWYTVSLLLLICSAGACAKGKSAAAANTSNVSAASPADPAISSDSSPPPAFDAHRAMQYVKEIVALGPRPIGSENHKKVENFILSHLKGDDIEQDAFDVQTSEGTFPVRNIIAKFPGTKDGIIVIASHYDTNWPLRNTSYVGANDGASSSALLLEFANQLRGKKLNGYSIWLLWDDAEESMRLPWYDPESLYGVRHIAEKWQGDGTLKKIKAFILEDMIGDADLNIDRDTYST